MSARGGGGVGKNLICQNLVIAKRSSSNMTIQGQNPLKKHSLPHKRGAVFIQVFESFLTI